MEREFDHRLTEVEERAKLLENSDKSKIYSKIKKEFHLLFSRLNLKEVKIEFNNYQENDFKRKLKRIERKCL